VPRMICDRCAQVIGVYEPMVVVVDGHPHETSRAAQPAAGHDADERFHLGCYERAEAGAAAEATASCSR
jgi:hypothetical protein